ncbi:MAG: hypothetical protein EOO01_00550, partial [Chitinophagaceae bacterium]
MQIIKSLTKLALFLLPFSAISQATYIPQGSKEYHMIDRLQIKQMKNTGLNFSSVKPFNRKYVVQEIEFIDSARHGYVDSLGADKFASWTDMNLTSIDEYNIRSILMNNSEWVTGSRSDFESRKPILNHFYKTKTNMLEVNTPDFFLAVNPVLQLNLSFEKGNDQQVYMNSRGLTARGRIANKIGFSATVIDNQERGPAHFSRLVKQLRAVPGNGFFKSFKMDSTAVDYFDARGYITFN